MYAQNENEAGTLASKFEQRSDPCFKNIDEIELIHESLERKKGVWWRSYERYISPIDNQN